LSKALVVSMVVKYRLFPCSWYLLWLHAETLSAALYSIGGKIQADKCSPYKLSKKCCVTCHQLSYLKFITINFPAAIPLFQEVSFHNTILLLLLFPFIGSCSKLQSCRIKF